MNLMNDRRESKKRAGIYLALVLGVCYIPGLLALGSADPKNSAMYKFLVQAFTAFPVLAALVTRLLTKDQSSWNLELRVWKNKKMMWWSAFGPGAAVLIGAGIYYIFFPNDLNGNIQALFTYCEKYGLPAGLAVNAGTVLLTAVVIWLVSALFIPLHLLELGEEIGWRGYLLPQFLRFMSVKKSVMLSGILWGLAHAPLIFFGFNYGDGYWGAPYTGIALMIIFCIGAGIWMSYTMIKTKNCMYSAIMHGAVNIAADLQILSVAVNRPLLGPAPTGVIGMSVILLISVILFVKMPDEGNVRHK
ncbi:MAG: CPBP family intramembrane metalloprotease [Firmicutes bacterium]|nr:CPBP family intramembrane metalloprotease [Bacillota bacterium]